MVPHLLLMLASYSFFKLLFLLVWLASSVSQIFESTNLGFINLSIVLL